MSYFEDIGRNPNGKTFFCGDIHGCYHDLLNILHTRKFDFNNDRLICTGDLIDRGPDSQLCLELLEKSWFYTVMGNHEDMMINCYCAPSDSSFRQWIINGGQWSSALDNEEAIYATNEILQLPIAIETTIGNKKIGVIHADPVYSDWEEIKKELKSENVSSTFVATALWSRSNSDSEFNVSNIDLVVHGHTIKDKIEKIGNRLFIDTGSFLKYWDGYDGHISVVSEEELLEFIE